ncbi:NADH-quinone oxidoreductase subunit M [Myxococcus sp. MISCRS1]|jgi:NADH-quinone oxidoreductase subunit M|uniref:complex I subunit 4 family protein n=1 Tax=Myxococcus TaxID=32 RepID=UPI001CBAA494|nr:MULTISPECIES: NADH-quinone oxidoreductase subunit M [unclassified Myxococcus]MBZ4397713.1 NADH-quinone oxidoreductase subunit M [Myxococcus sp. AS-1-15]MBZ4407721.1 NADH-quinone oxidoreductase subunit M [Myxococcus sp. XM-1-1-1]MCY0998449.1 NADH-quinone oxidoreductase subunit M [Myxococcus sp. MISCRS1]BDT31561.1 NADH-quinone oxidoreductase subunit M [Myxococcus sp. MH1]
MSFFDTHLLNLVVFLPLVFAALVLMLPAGEAGQIRTVTFIGMVVDLVFGVWAYSRFEVGGPEFQLEYRVPWFQEFGLSYHLGVDGLAVSLILLTVFLGPLVVLASTTYISHRIKEFHLALLVLQTTMLGALVSLDVLLFYIFFEAMLIPMYLLVGVWGAEDRQMAAVKFFLYTLVGSLLMLVALIAVYFISSPAGARSFDYASIYNGLLDANRQLSACSAGPAGACDSLTGMAATLHTYGPWLFAAFALAFAIKVPMWPVHTWLPDAHVQAPVAGSMILAGVMLKMGTFGFWRYAIPLFPVAAQQARPFLATLAVIGIVYGALMCLAQRDIKKLIAYSSVSHLGYCMLGIFALTAEGATGSAYQMLNHGVSTGALFLLFGFLYERRHSRLMADFGGIAKVMPVFTTAFIIITFSSVAVPGTNGFIGEFLVLLGTFKSDLGAAAGNPHLTAVFGAFATTGVILGAAYMLWMVQKVFFGGLTHRENQHLRDMNVRESLTVLPFIILVGVMGLMPQPFLDRIEPSTERFLSRARVGTPGAGVQADQVRVEVMSLPANPTVAAPSAPAPLAARAVPSSRP